MPRLRPFLAGAALALLAFVPRAAHAADDADAASPLRPGAWALQFAIRDNFQLGSFAGSTISVKHHSSAKTAWRAGLSLNLLALDRTNTFADADTALDSKASLDQQGIGLEVHRLSYFDTAGRVHPYVGLGPEVAYSHQDQTPETNGTKASLESWSAGIGGDFGVEWTATRAIGVHAEYGVFAGYRKSTQESEPVPNPLGLRQELEETAWQFDDRGVRFGVSAYF